ncbi:SE1832 family protein [Caldibacillus lycopersici]|uniref:SE1832 family protein n=1 Tax=Perspicuibacillus lycopersici TaxID=1325689 RepID=A0AAE3IRP4_9BACI|nr:SE1832 family protein [Perspicuibacillus lycopersici]MCU9613373.1 SE1832 family protein [Perspicuibacillus lycopersici]
MTKEEIQRKIEELKSDYVRLQADLEKLTFVGGNGAQTEKVLESMEIELRELRRMLEA